MRRAVRGQDAVISIVVSEGRGQTTVVSDVTRAELIAMREAGVRRLVSVSVSAIEGRRPWILINLVRWILRKPYADFARMERLITSSPVDWTIVRPPYLSNGRKTGRVRTQVGGKDLPRGPYHISRADLAATLVDLAEDSHQVRAGTQGSNSSRSEKGCGDSSDVIYWMIGIEFPETFTYSEYAKTKRVAARYEGRMTGSMGITLEPKGSTTLATLDVNYEVRPGPFGKIANKLLFERMDEKTADRMLENIKMVIEATK